jgi:hypothetical protein
VPAGAAATNAERAALLLLLLWRGLPRDDCGSWTWDGETLEGNDACEGLERKDVLPATLVCVSLPGGGVRYRDPRLTTDRSAVVVNGEGCYEPTTLVPPDVVELLRYRCARAMPLVCGHKGSRGGFMAATATRRKATGGTGRVDLQVAAFDARAAALGRRGLGGRPSRGCKIIVIRSRVGEGSQSADGAGRHLRTSALLAGSGRHAAAQGTQPLGRRGIRMATTRALRRPPRRGRGHDRLGGGGSTPTLDTGRTRGAPPRDDAALAGVFRGGVLSEGTARERVETPHEPAQLSGSAIVKRFPRARLGQPNREPLSVGSAQGAPDE